MVIASLLLLCSGIAAEGVTLDMGIESLPAVVQRVAEQTGMKLRVQKELADEPIFAKLKNRAPQETLDLLAKVVSAEWVKKDEEMILQRSPAFLRKLTEQDQARRAKDLAFVLGKESAGIDMTPWPDRDPKELTAALAADANRVLTNTSPDYDRMMRQSLLRGPAGRMAYRIANPDALPGIMSIPLGERRVYSSVPTAMQYRLGAAGRAAFTTYEKEWAWLWKHLGGMEKPRREAELERFGLHSLYPMPLEGPFQLRVIVARTSNTGLVFSTTVTSATGVPVERADLSLLLHKYREAPKLKKLRSGAGSCQHCLSPLKPWNRELTRGENCANSCRRKSFFL